MAARSEIQCGAMSGHGTIILKRFSVKHENFFLRSFGSDAKSTGIRR